MLLDFHRVFNRKDIGVKRSNPGFLFSKKCTSPDCTENKCGGDG